MWAGQPACVSGIAAAYWWGLITVAPTRVEITIPRTRRLRSRPEAVIKRRFLPPEDRAFLRDVPVTGLPLTSLHAAVALGSAGPEMLDRALQTRVRFADVRAAHYRNLGCHGSHDAGLLLIAAGDRAAAQSVGGDTRVNCLPVGDQPVLALGDRRDVTAMTHRQSLTCDEAPGWLVAQIVDNFDRCLNPSTRPSRGPSR